MLRLVHKMPLRRLIHTSTTRPMSSAIRGRRGFALGATAAVTTYVTWKMVSQQGIALDSVPSSSNHTAPKAKAAPPAKLTPLEVSPDDSVVPAELVQKAEEAAESTEAAPAQGEDDEHEGGGAFNPVTGEINWDCPCLGGMAHGPCGLQFREAFSCFVFSEQEPKGIDCVERFKAMQDCFREHPDVYADEIMDDDDDEAAADLDTPAASQDPVPSEHVTDPASLDTIEEPAHTHDSEQSSS